MLISCDHCGLRYDEVSKQAVHHGHKDFCSKQCKEDYIDDQFRIRARNLRESQQLECYIELGLVGAFGK